MAIFDLFSKRQKRQRGEVPDVLIHNPIPERLRVQIIHIIKGVMEEKRYPPYWGENIGIKAYEFLQEALCREYGLFKLGSGHSNEEQVLNFLLGATENDQVIDTIELTFGYLKGLKDIIPVHPSNQLKIDKAITELNERFKEEGIGYAFEGGKIIRIDSTYIHTEITKPTIFLLQNRKFQGANEEYFNAHKHYRHGRNKECLAECLKAFESTMKVICQEKGWIFNQTDTSKKLINICMKNELIPSFMQEQIRSLQNLLESGIPTIRNRLGGHGQGQIPQKVDDEITRYGLNLTGTNIVFLIEQSGIK